MSTLIRHLQYTIHRLGQMFSSTEPLESFLSAMTYQKHLGRDQALLKTAINIEQDLVSMAGRYNPQVFPAPADSAGESQVVIITNPLGVEGINVVVWGIGLTTNVGTPKPKEKPKVWYGKSVNKELFVAKSHISCVGCMMTTLVNRTKTVQNADKSTESPPTLEQSKGDVRSAASLKDMCTAPFATTFPQPPKVHSQRRGEVDCYCHLKENED